MAPLSDSESQTLPVCFIIVPLPNPMLQAFEYTCYESIPILNVDTIRTMQWFQSLDVLRNYERKSLYDGQS